MNKKIVFTCVFLLMVVLVGYFYNKWYFEELHKKTIMYPYETFLGPANHVLFVSDLKNADELYSYYEYVRVNKKYRSFSFPLEGLPQKEPVYILGYNNDSTIAEIVSLYYRGRSFGGGFTQGWMATSTLHRNPPPDSLMPGKYRKSLPKSY